jgi:hypothetical protein
LFVVPGVCACTVRHVILCFFAVEKENGQWVWSL